LHGRCRGVTQLAILHSCGSSRRLWAGLVASGGLAVSRETDQGGADGYRKSGVYWFHTCSSTKAAIGTSSLQCMCLRQSGHCVQAVCWRSQLVTLTTCSCSAAKASRNGTSSCLWPSWLASSMSNSQQALSVSSAVSNASRLCATVVRGSVITWIDLSRLFRSKVT